MSLFSMAMSLPPDFRRLKPPKVEVPVELLEAHRAKIAAAEEATPVLKCASEPPTKYSQFVERCTDFKDASAVTSVGDTKGSRTAGDFSGAATGTLIRLMRSYHNQLGARTIREIQGRPECGPESPDQHRFLRLLTARLAKPSKKQQLQQQQQQQQQQQLSSAGQQDHLEVSFNDSSQENYLANYTAVCSYCRRKAATSNPTGIRGNARQRRYHSNQPTGLSELPPGVEDLGSEQAKIGVLERLALLNTAAQRAQNRANRSVQADSEIGRASQQQQQQHQQTARNTAAAMIEVPESHLVTKQDVDALRFQTARQELSMPAHPNSDAGVDDQKQQQQEQQQPSRPVSIPIIGTAVQQQQKPASSDGTTTRSRRKVGRGGGAGGGSATSTSSSQSMAPAGASLQSNPASMFPVPKVTQSLLQSFLGPGQADDTQLYLAMRQQFLRDVVHRSVGGSSGNESPHSSMVGAGAAQSQSAALSSRSRAGGASKPQLERLDEEGDGGCVSLPDMR